MRSMVLFDLDREFDVDVALELRDPVELGTLVWEDSDGTFDVRLFFAAVLFVVAASSSGLDVVEEGFPLD